MLKQIDEVRLSQQHGRQEISVSLPPEESVIAAHAQPKKDYQTGNYKEKYKANRAKYGRVCGGCCEATE